MKKFLIIISMIFCLTACLPEQGSEVGDTQANGATISEATLTLESTATSVKQDTTAPIETSTEVVSSTETVMPDASPAWIAEFAEPILAEIENREPDFQDDFSVDTQRWYPISLYGMDMDKALVIQDGVMRLDDAHGISNYYFVNKPNIVMKVDVLNPFDTVFILPTFYFRHFTTTNGDYFLLSTVGYWEVRDENHTFGSGRYTPGEQKIEVMMIVVNSQIAYYINGMPAAYIEDPRLLAEENDNKVYFDCTLCTLDNVKVWKLDNISAKP